VDVRPFEERDLDGVLALCRAEGWPSLPADPARAARILTNPGVTTSVAVEGPTVVGFAYVLSDGAVAAYLASMAVAADHRRRGVGTRLIQDAFARCGAERLDTLSDADEFYEQLLHHRWSGFRLYPPFAR
jgi:ribosomal protein S18 acetylase RimI-like enzyme